MDGRKIKVTLLHSKYGRGRKQLGCVNGLGLRRINHSVEVEDTPAVRGMINKVIHLVKVEDNDLLPNLDPTQGFFFFNILKKT